MTIPSDPTVEEIRCMVDSMQAQAVVNELLELGRRVCSETFALYRDMEASETARHRDTMQAIGQAKSDHMSRIWAWLYELEQTMEGVQCQR